MRARWFFAALVFAFGLVTVFSRLESAQEHTQSTNQYVTMTWSFRNNHPNEAYLRIYRQNADGVWPGPDKFYTLDDSKAHAAKLSCWAGEKICYGAFTKSGTEWGVGKSGKRSCQQCCATCQSGDIGTINLDP
jgi:hypothetical protein